MTDRSRLAEVLGVEEDEEFELKDFNATCRIHNGELQYDFSKYRCWLASTRIDILTAIINNPSLIRRKPRFTDEEMTVLRWLHKHGKLKNCKFVFGDPYAETGGKYNLTGNIVDYLLKPGEMIDLDEMFKEDADND